MTVNGWQLYAYPLFEQQLRALKENVKQNSTRVENSRSRLKLLRAMERVLYEVVPTDPSSPQFRQGNTLGKGNRQWFRAKFLVRYRLFFRFSTQEKAIVYAWMNDEATLRKSGSKTDPYAVFETMLEAGDPPRTFDELLTRSRAI